MFLLGLTKNGLDVARSAIKLPEAYRSGRLLPALAQVVTASPTTHLLDPNAPRVATAASHGRSFTKVDELGYRTASLLGVGIGAFQFASGVPNVYRAVHEGGPKALVDTREGRTGALQVASGALTLGTFGRAGAVARAAGVRGPARVALAAAGSASLTSPLILGTTLASSGLVLANDHGFLDFMNRGEQRSFGQVERDSWRATGLDDKVDAAAGATGRVASSTYGSARKWVERRT
jgi:hypothetical protein